LLSATVTREEAHPAKEAAPRVWTVKELVAWMTDDLRKRGIESARIDSELIVAHVLQVDRIKILLSAERELSADELERIRALLKRRRTFEPIAYLRGEREFYGHRFLVDGRVLVPRPDTETLVEVALKRLIGRELSGRVLDLCTGSGCVAISLKLERPTITVDAVDVSRDALAVARDNAQRLGAVWNVSFAEGDLFTPLPSRPYDLVTANPPYIASAEVPTLQRDVADHEPRLALDGGDDGLAIVRRIVDEAPRWLRAGGALAMEVGAGQADEVRALFASRDFSDVRVARDYGGIDRVVSGIWPAPTTKSP
ncbi:MAG: peptide chain release factor N(5)-glutamine methyltransferase, partial [Polyangiales bacterium]